MFYKKTPFSYIELRLVIIQSLLNKQALSVVPPSELNESLLTKSPSILLNL